MSDFSQQNEDPSRRYWKTVIAALPTPAKRDAAWEFYMDKVADSRVGDTLSGLILLLEANGAFLLTLPETFHAALTQPIAKQVDGLREELREHAERQTACSDAVGLANKALERGNQLLVKANGDFSGKVAAAASQIDVMALARAIYLDLAASTLSPLRFALDDLPAQSERITAATKAVESSIQTWRAVHLRGIFLNFSLAVLLFGSLGFGTAWYRLRGQLNQRLAGEIARLHETGKTFENMALLNVPVHLKPSPDQEDDRTSITYALYIDKAEAAAIQEIEGKKRGVIFFKAQRLTDHIREVQRLIDEIQKPKR